MTKSKHQEKIDRFTKELETFIDLRYRINKENDLCNQNFVIKNLLQPYKNSRLALEEIVKELLDINSEE